MRTLLAGIALALAFQPASVSAQRFAGNWYCQMTYTELDRWGNRTSGHAREYAMALYPNGNYEVQGVMSGANGQQQFISAGQWLHEGDMMRLEGPERQPGNPYYPDGMVFYHFGQMQSDGTMMFRYEMPDPSQSYVMNRTLSQCRPN